MKGNKWLTLIITATLLSSCSAYKNKFDCPPSNGAVCRSVEDIERMVDSGEIWKLHQGDNNSKGRRRVKDCGNNCSRGKVSDDDTDDGYNL